MTGHKEWQAQVIEMARWHGWRCYHTHDSRRSPAGFPDLVLVHPDSGVMFAELKTGSGRLRQSQRDWKRWLEEAGSKVYVWRPEDVDAVLAVLRTPAR